MAEPLARIAEGRDTDILDYGPGLVLRRPKVPRSLAAEAEIMTWVIERGYPCPPVVELVDDGLVMARVEGVSMLDDLLAHPWRVRAHATLLADLHGWLHRLPAPDHLPRPFGPGTALVHGDLHPGNVLLSPEGPMVIDWTNAAAGPVGADLALTWLLVSGASVEMPPVQRVLAGALRAMLVRTFLAAADRDAAVASLATVLDHRRRDPNLSPGELEAMRRIVAHNQPG
jgi:aminoglycoside phosphotransferase (APT) family kinase protein